jgi:hypothetical protein
MPYIYKNVCVKVCKNSIFYKNKTQLMNRLHFGWISLTENYLFNYTFQHISFSPLERKFCFSLIRLVETHFILTEYTP